MGKWVRKGKFTDLSTKIFDQPFLIFPFRPFSRFLLIISLNHLFSFSILFHSTVSISQPSIFLFYPVSFHCPYLSTVCFPFLSCFFPLSLSLNHLFSCSILFPFTVHISHPSVFLFYPVSFHCLYFSTIYFPFYPVSFHCLYLSTVCFPFRSCFIPLLPILSPSCLRFIPHFSFVQTCSPFSCPTDPYSPYHLPTMIIYLSVPIYLPVLSN